MTRHFRAKLTIHPESRRLGFWRGNLDAHGNVVDEFVFACHDHPTEYADDCDACRVPHDGASDHATD